LSFEKKGPAEGDAYEKRHVKKSFLLTKDRVREDVAFVLKGFGELTVKF